MATKKVTHAELAAAQERKDWALLWQHAMPIVKMSIRKAMAHGWIDPYYVRDDMYQEANLAGLQALRTWDPLRGAFSTWIRVNVVGAIRKHNTREAGGMVGGRDVGVPVIGMHAAPGMEQSGDDEQVDRGLEASIVYETPPEGYDDPSVELEKAQRQVAVETALASLPDEERDILNRLYGVGGPQESQQQYIARSGVPERTARRRQNRGLEKMAAFLKNPVSLL